MAFQIKIPLDTAMKVAVYCFILAVVLLIAYQISYLIVSVNAPFFEPDNYIYLLFANLAIQHNSFAVSNPYLITFYYQGFFEHYGLFETPVLLHQLIPFIPLVWDFRILYIIPVIITYLLTLLIAKRILDNTPINKGFKYVAYTLILFNSFLLQQTEIIEWRGNIFTSASILIIFSIICYLYTEKNLTWKRRLMLCAAIVLAITISWYMWQGWPLALFPLALIPIFEIYKRIKGGRVYWFMALAAVIIGILVGLAPSSVDTFIINSALNIEAILHTGALHQVATTNCSYNPLSLGEVQCLTGYTGLYALVAYLIFFAFAFRVFLSDTVFARDKDKYEFFLAGAFFMSIMLLPVAMVYLRIIQLIAPYLAIGFSLGLAALLSRGGASRVIQLCMVVIVILSSLGGFLTFWQASIGVYSLNNPPGLLATAGYLSNYPNSSVLIFYGWGDYLENYAHVRVYADTIEELSYTIILPMDSFFYDYPVNCSYIQKLNKTPNYIVLSPVMSKFVLFDNASNSSLAKNPNNVAQCGYSLAYQNQSFFVFKKN